MSKLTIFVSATIVLIFANPQSFASPQMDAPDSPETESPWPSGKPPDDLAISKPKSINHSVEPPSAMYYPYQQQLTFRFGKSQELGKTSAEKNDNIIGFQYLFPKFLSPKIEFAADLHTAGRGHVFVGKRWIWWERSYFRPSLKASIDHHVNSSEKLATLGQIENWYARATVTLEYVVWNPYSLRLEFDGLAGTKSTFAEVTLGLSRGW